MSEDNRLPRDREEPVSTDPGDTAPTREPEEGPVRRPLIRATLTFPEGTPATPREHPVFTMHQQQPSGNGRGGGGGGGGNWSGRGGSPNGNRKKGAQAARGSGGGKKFAPRGERNGSARAVNGNRPPSGRGKGRAR